MRSLTFLLRVLMFALSVRAKHDGETSDDDHDPSSTSSTPAPSQSSTSTSTVLSTSTFTLTQGTPITSSSTTAASTAIPSGALQFTPPANVTTCAPAIFTWEFDASASVPLTIVVTNERAVQSPAPNQAPLVERTLSTAVDSLTCVVAWSQVNVPAGAYTLLATDTARTGSVSAQSSSFFVNSGQDTSCLNMSSTSSASAAAASASDSSGGDGSASDTANPPTSSRSPKSMSTGAIVGTIAGILVGVGGLLIVFSLPRLRRRILRSKPPRHPGAPYILF